MLLTTPLEIRTLQRKLYAKAKKYTAQVMCSENRAHRCDPLSRAGKCRTVDYACLGVKNIGKPCAGKSHARFDQGGQAKACSLLYPISHGAPGQRSWLRPHLLPICPLLLSGQ